MWLLPSPSLHDHEIDAPKTPNPFSISDLDATSSETQNAESDFSNLFPTQIETALHENFQALMHQ